MKVRNQVPCRDCGKMIIVPRRLWPALRPVFCNACSYGDELDNRLAAIEQARAIG